jgi:pyridoxamine 5'-phosphate oxidase
MSEPADHLNEQNVERDPVKQFAIWFAQARACHAMPEAMALASASADAVPSLRMVLLKEFDERGFVFFTNYESRKGGELTANPLAALLFHWDPPGRQVRIEGAVERVSAEESAAYARTRRRGSQLSVLASPQSRPIESRAVLERRVAELEQRLAGAEPPLPDHWGGFRVAIETVEFWQQRADRLHDRLRYRRAQDGGWLIERLAP